VGVIWCLSKYKNKFFNKKFTFFSKKENDQNNINILAFHVLKKYQGHGIESKLLEKIKSQMTIKDQNLVEFNFYDFPESGLVLKSDAKRRSFGLLQKNLGV
jgi:GNAT superfamily N-acetyltransferase